MHFFDIYIIIAKSPCFAVITSQLLCLCINLTFFSINSSFTVMLCISAAASLNATSSSFCLHVHTFSTQTMLRDCSGES